MRAESKITPETLEGLTPGQVIEVGEFMPALGKEPLCFELVSVNKEKCMYQFEVYAFEIFMLTAFAKIDSKGKILWEIEK